MLLKCGLKPEIELRQFVLCRRCLLGIPVTLRRLLCCARLKPERSETLVERSVTIENRDTEHASPAYQPQISSSDPFGALDGAVFERSKGEARPISLSQIDQVSRRAAARYVTKMEGYDSLKQLALFESLRFGFDERPLPLGEPCKF